MSKSLTDPAAAFAFAGLPVYDPDEYEHFKSDARGVFCGYDEQDHTPAERAAAAIRYLRVQCCQHAYRYAINRDWAAFLARYPDFAAWVCCEFANYAHEFDASEAAAILAEYGPVLSRAQYDAMSAECMAVHLGRGTDKAKDRELIRIIRAYTERVGESGARP